MTIDAKTWKAWDAANAVALRLERERLTLREGGEQAALAMGNIMSAVDSLAARVVLLRNAVQTEGMDS